MDERFFNRPRDGGQALGAGGVSNEMAAVLGIGSFAWGFLDHTAIQQTGNVAISAPAPDDSLSDAISNMRIGNN
ncbi:MAG: hypothetical protein JXR42_04100 [Gammaproteobacteria bacterium]|nr:hypothetical protein [Gammaproteobacteria bacterium]